jgi:RHS repeat-associated protein
MQPSPQSLRCGYRYDPLDRLISHILPGNSERMRFYCKSRLAVEIQGALHHTIVQQGDQLLAEQEGEGAALNTTLLITDQQRSILHTLKANQPTQHIVYTPYGHHPSTCWLLSLLDYNGERPDPVTGHYLLGNGFRAFNPVLMRFNSPDNWSPFGQGGLNAYAYCSGDPINRRDNNGHFSFKTIAATVITLQKVHKRAIALQKLPPAQRITYLEHSLAKKTDHLTNTIFHNDIATLTSASKTPVSTLQAMSGKVLFDNPEYLRGPAIPRKLKDIIETGPMMSSPSEHLKVLNHIKKEPSDKIKDISQFHDYSDFHDQRLDSSPAGKFFSDRLAMTFPPVRDRMIKELTYLRKLT